MVESEWRVIDNTDWHLFTADEFFKETIAVYLVAQSDHNDKRNIAVCDFGHLSSELRRDALAVEADRRLDQPITELIIAYAARSHEQLLVVAVHIVAAAQEKLVLVLAAEMWRHDVTARMRRLKQKIFAVKVGLETDLACKERREVDSLSSFQDAQHAIKAALVFAEGARLGGVTDASFDAKSLDPTLIEPGRVFEECLERVPKVVLHRGAGGEVVQRWVEKQVALRVVHMNAYACQALLS